MRCITLASGSKGNCAYIESEGRAILIDAGHSVRETFRRMHEAGVDPSNVDGIIVTHEHSDHVKGLLPLARRLGVPVFGTGGTLRPAYHTARHRQDPGPLFGMPVQGTIQNRRIYY